MPDQPEVPEQPRTTVTVRDGVADVRLNRPAKLNAFDRGMFDALVATGEALAADNRVRAVVLSGEGRAFSAGLDLSMFGQMANPSSSVGQDLVGGRVAGPANRAQQAVWIWRALEVPVIAAVHGPALGAGCQLALGADLRIVAPDAQLSVLEIRWGLIPDMAGTYLLPRLVGPDVAKELLWSGRMVSGEEAVRIGMATRVADDPLAAALDLAGEIASKSPHAIRQGKRLIDASLDRGPEEQLLDEEKTMVSLIGSANQKEAVAAWFDKRPPAYSDV
ncbi:crotonase/enoyl-CoA hydratase family protein [Acidiferrimicrobium sp. IK]|uniref:crotonase/enoyl-CoA hydratase family protein n=1 Tax=Acidiferrimicrobium sp. IK TaxID=2871700 RepID=UPI0021CB8A27|nr:crotonase/enoyl-CoA hydratase family protein [Acidiferrimicrobium sp. IK]MCU4184914.1 crotonase/enoyl-CoA hydratase family protein [Acidiferrimicrobium sp. IK]